MDSIIQSFTSSPSEMKRLCSASIQATLKDAKVIILDSDIFIFKPFVGYLVEFSKISPFQNAQDSK